MLLQTAREYKGAGKMSADFGGVRDQATYQAAICLIAQGKAKEGRAELIRFMKAEPLSPLVSAAAKRVTRLDGKLQPEIEALLEKDQHQQEAEIRFATSVCGPKCVEKVLPLLGKPGVDFRLIAAKCGHSNNGTTCADLRKGLLAYGVKSFAFDLSAEDFSRIAGPAILIEPGHYRLLEKIEAGKAHIYDPKDESVKDEDLPTDPQKPVSVILFSLPTLSS